VRLQADSTKQADNNTYPPEAENEAAGARMRALYGLLLRINTATTTSGVAGRGATNGHSLDPADPPTHPPSEEQELLLDSDEHTSKAAAVRGAEGRAAARMGPDRRKGRQEHRLRIVHCRHRAFPPRPPPFPTL
jgi:hypothetical protein